MSEFGYRLLLHETRLLHNRQDQRVSVETEQALATLPLLALIPPDLRLEFDRAMVDLYIAEIERRGIQRAWLGY